MISIASSRGIGTLQSVDSIVGTRHVVNMALFGFAGGDVCSYGRGAKYMGIGWFCIGLGGCWLCNC